MFIKPTSSQQFARCNVSTFMRWDRNPSSLLGLHNNYTKCINNALKVILKVTNLTFLFCIGTKNKLNINSKTVQYDAQESFEVINCFKNYTFAFAIQKPPNSQECQHLEDMYPDGVEEIVPIQKKLSNGSQLLTTPSRKCPPSTLSKHRKSSQHSNTVLYDEVGLAKIKGNVSDMTEVELKANESYGHTDKKCSTAKSNVAACQLCLSPGSKIQQDLSLSHQYSEIKVTPKNEHPELNTIEQEQIELKSNQSYCQLTGAVGQIGGCEPQHEYDYIYVDP